jgi:hypothetical protein
MIIKNKKAIGKMIISIILTLLGIYLSLYILPDWIFPKAKLILNLINYFLILIFFGVIQIGLIYAYYKLGKYATRGFTIIKTKLMNWSINIRNYIVIHS